MIGERLRVARARHRRTLSDVAKVCGVSPQAVKKYEDDVMMPNSKAFVAICDYLDISPEWLMAGVPLDFRSTEEAPQGRHAKYWAREAIAELRELGYLRERDK